MEIRVVLEALGIIHVSGERHSDPYTDVVNFTYSIIENNNTGVMDDDRQKHQFLSSLS